MLSSRWQNSKYIYRAFCGGQFNTSKNITSFLFLFFVFKSLCCQKNTLGLAMVSHAFNPNTKEAEAGKFLSSRPAWEFQDTRAIQRNPVLNKWKIEKEKHMIFFFLILDQQDCSVVMSTCLSEDQSLVPSTYVGDSHL